MPNSANCGSAPRFAIAFAVMLALLVVGCSSHNGGPSGTPASSVPQEVFGQRSPSPGSDQVGVSIHNNQTGKVEERPNGAERALGEYASTLRLTDPDDRQKLVQKWIELAGTRAAIHTVTIWAADGRAYQWPPKTK